MATRRTHYDELGLARDASPQEIEKAYQRYRALASHESAAPDRARDARVQSAYDTLSRPEKRELYDMMLRLPERKRRSKGVWAALGGVAVLAGVAAAAFLLQPPPPPPPGTLGADEIAHKAALAVNRVDSTDIAGKATPVGLAFAVGEGTVATSCHGITPMSVLTLFMPPRAIPVKVAHVDEGLGLCKLSATGIGSFPLAVAAGDPHPGDTVYMTKVNAVGEVGLVEAKVKRVVPSPRGKVVEMSIAVLPERNGGPVLDTFGRVIGVAVLAQAASTGEVVRVTPEWAEREQPVQPAQPVSVPTAAPVEAPKPRGLKTREELLEERRKAVDEAVKKSTE